MTKKPLIALAAVAVLTLGLQGCGDGGRPSKSDISKSIGGKDGLPDDQADCVADKLLDSDLSDKELRAVADDDKSDISKDEQAEVIDVITKAAGTCVTG